MIYFPLYIRTLARRKEPHIYVANWYYMAFIVVVAILHIVNNLAVPVSLGHAKSYTLFGGAGCHGGMVVRSQRRGLLPDLRLFRYDVLLPAEAGGPADLFLPVVYHQLLGDHLFLYVGGLASPALHGAAALGADARHDLFADAAGPILGIGRQCAADAERRLAQGPRRRHACAS